jgi:hypothetical protein
MQGAIQKYRYREARAILFDLIVMLQKALVMVRCNISVLQSSQDTDFGTGQQEALT